MARRQRPDGIVKLTRITSIRPTRYWALARRGPIMLGIKNSRQPQLDNTLWVMLVKPKAFPSCCG